MKWAVFLDRDGTINKELEYLNDPKDLRLIPGAAEAIRVLNETGVPVVLVTNQAGIGRGYFSEVRLKEIRQELARRLAANDAHLDAIYYCPHHPDEGCDCRKPNTGMLVRAAQRHDIDLQRSFVVGDKIGDLDAGRRVGCRTVLVLTGYGMGAREHFKSSNYQPDFTAQNLLEAARWILAQRGLM